jgi:tRNA-splicing ligase RtcB
MDPSRFERKSECEWHISPFGPMRVPGVIFASESLLRDMDDKVYEQVTNVAMLPGIVEASWAMPDAHWGYGFPIGGVAAFDAEAGGVISAGGVGFDISCGVRALHTGLAAGDINSVKDSDVVKTQLANALYHNIPAGMGRTGSIALDATQMDAMLLGGAHWAVERGFGMLQDLEHIEESGCMSGADPSQVSDQAKRRQRNEMGTLGSGNHYLEIQLVTDVYADEIAEAFGIKGGDVMVSIHCGSRGLGHQIGTEFLKRMVMAAPDYGIDLPDRELACAPISSPLGRDYLGAMRAAINCALANRQILTHLTRQVFSKLLPQASLRLLYDVSHNTCKLEEHIVGGRKKKLYVHRKGATRAFAPGHPDLPKAFRNAGQPILIGGSMGTASYILAGTKEGAHLAFGSACHGAGRAMSRHQALRNWDGRHVVDDLQGHGILIRSPSMRGVAEEAPGAYKDVTEVVDTADRAGLARKVARLAPLICIKG